MLPHHQASSARSLTLMHLGSPTLCSGHRCCSTMSFLAVCSCASTLKVMHNCQRIPLLLSFDEAFRMGTLGRVFYAWNS